MMMDSEEEMREAIYGGWIFGVAERRLRLTELVIKCLKCKPVVDELRYAKGWGVSQLCVGHLGWTACLIVQQQYKPPILTSRIVMFMGIMHYFNIYCRFY